LCSLVIFLFLICPGLHAQVSDTANTSEPVRKHSPRKAVVCAIVCPGLGQIYNQKYWKLPIVYGAIGTFGYFINYNQLKYKKFKNAYESGSSQVIIDGISYESDILDLYMNFYRRYRDLCVLGLGAVYFLTIVDAMVDAHFFYYDVTDDLSLRIEPAMLESPGMTAALGFRINLGF
jgi:hypothetical protein